MPDDASVATYRALSLGAGSSSSVLADCYYLAETTRLIAAGYETTDMWRLPIPMGTRYVYKHLNWLGDST